MRARGGTVRIRIIDYENIAEISIEDDGIGIDEKALERLLDSKLTGRTGIGLINTDRRLKQIYGKGLQIRSSPNQGTVVSFTVTK